MMKRMMFLAAGVIASLAITTSSHAASVTTGVVITPNGLGATALDVEITYTGGTLSGVYSNLTGSLAGDVSSIGLSGGGTIVTIDFTSATTGGKLGFDFTVASGTPTVGTSSLTGISGNNPSNNPIGVAAGASPTVPEPSTMALLGIGMTSFLAFRRFFKRSPVA